MRLHEIFPDVPYLDTEVTKVTVRDDINGEYRSPGVEHVITAFFVSASGDTIRTLIGSQ